MRMLGHKRKHKRMAVERMADRKRRAPARTADQLMVTRRTFVFKGLAAASFAALTGRLWQLQIRDHEDLKARGADFWERRFPLPAARGMIYDRRGQLLAENKKSWAVAIVPANLPQDEAARATIFATLSRHLGMGDIVTIVPKEFPAAAAGRAEIAARLAAILGVPAAAILDAVASDEQRPANARQRVIQVSGAAVPPERLAAVRAALPDLPGVAVANPIGYLYATKGLFDRYQPLTIKKGIAKEVALGIEANRLYLPGVQIDDQALSRRYLVGEELGHILGYTGPIGAEQYEAAVMRDERGQTALDASGNPVRVYAPEDHVGQAGLEAALEDTLRGKPGSFLAQMNAAGKISGEYAQYRRDPVEGHSVVLTIDTDFQREMITILQRGIEAGIAFNRNYNATELRGKKQRFLPPGTGAAVALDPRTGEVLALVSLPSYDPRHFADGISQQQFDAYTEVGVPKDQRRIPLLNRCVAASFPPGSTLKTFMAAAGLQEACITPDTKFKCLGRIEVPWTWNELVRDPYWCYTRDATHQDQDVMHALATSCDVFFYTLSAPRQIDERGIATHFYLPDDPEPKPFAGLGIERINTYLNRFGFGDKTGIELANEDTGLVPGPDWKEKVYNDFWAIGDTLNTSIGQGYDMVTPLQLCNATAAISNGGLLFQPTLVHRILDSRGRVVRGPTPRVLRKLPIDQAHLNVVRQGLLMSTTDPAGLVSHAPADGKPDKFPLPPGIQAGVKTGTAEFGAEEEVDEDGRFLRAHAWCTAFAPFENPEICVVAFIEGGFGSADVAAPVASAMIRAYYARYHPEQWAR